ncbi:hypothetical protein KY284_020058 [Solanum tuberosum]|nr:hypothetical protein KY284_020058 [Solanum tuberosum]
MHPVSHNEAFENLSETNKDGENGGRHFSTETNQISFTNELASQHGTNLVEMENENETPYNLIDIPMYDGTGLPQSHLKAYLDWLASIAQGNEFNMRLFVRTLTGLALMWYANQDTWKWFSWIDMAKDFIKQYGPPNRASKGCDFLRRKSMESLEGIKGHESQKKVAESILGHYCLNEVQSRDKGKTIVTKESNVPPLVPEARKTQTFTPLSEPISFIFEKLRSLKNLQPKYREIPLNSFNPAKQCTFHSGMLGHTTNECHCLKKEVQKLLDNGMIIQR